MIPLLLSLVTYLPANEYFHGVQLNVGANYNDKKLVLTGYGLGSKKVGLARAKVAVNEFFTENPTAFIRTEDGVLNSLNNVGVMNMRLTFLRALDATQVQGFISQYLKYSLNPEEATKYKEDIAKVTTAIGKESAIYAGKTVSITGDVANNNIYYSNSAGESTMIHSQQTGFVVKLFSVWFGEPIDNDAYNLRLNLLQERTVTPEVRK